VSKINLWNVNIVKYLCITEIRIFFNALISILIWKQVRVLCK